MRQLFILVTIEGLGTNLMGCYGGAISKTPHLDHFASTAVAFDQCWLQSLKIVDSLEAICVGSKFLLQRQSKTGNFVEPANVDENEPLDLCQWFETQDLPTHFVTDSQALAEEAFLDRFTHASVIEFEPATTSAETLDQTRIAKLFQYAITQLFETGLDQEELEGGLLWIHATGLSSEWDAPYELRTIPCDEEDPEPSRDVEPPALLVDESTDLDVLFNVICGGSAQAAAIDFAWSYINELIAELSLPATDDSDRQPMDPCVVLLGLGGYPMGEHRTVGLIDQHLWAERLHVPLIIRPGSLPVGQRLPHLVQPWQIADLLRQVSQLTLDEDQSNGPVLPINLQDAFWQSAPMLPIGWPINHRIAWAASSSELALITAAWSASIPTKQHIAGQRPNEQIDELEWDFRNSKWRIFANPDDRWQQNDVMNRVQKVAEQLDQIAKRLQVALYGSEGRIDLAILQTALESLLIEELISPYR